ncbi:MAG: ECF transporter S component [Sphaerobacter sp.]|nr:ECF transporter S component [Sphaerobacter sp.]
MEPPRDRPRFALSARLVAIIGVMIAVVFVATFSIKIPIPGGYIHFGDIAIYFAAFVFGPVVGAIAAAVGPTLSDLLAYPSYAPGTFVIHGLQGLVAGLIGWRAGLPRMILSVLAGGAIIVGGYFVYDLAVVRVGLGVAITDAGFNTLQAVTGAVVAIPLVLAVRQAYPPITTWTHRRVWHEEPK